MIPRSLWKKNMAAEGCCLLWMMLSLTLFELFVLRSLRRLSLDKVGEPSIVFEDSSMFEPVLLEYKTTEANWLQSVVREGKVGSFTSQCYERLIFNPFEHHFFTQKVISRSIYNLKIDTIYVYDIPFDRSFLQLSNGIRHVMPSTDRKLELTVKASMAQPVSQPAVCSNGLNKRNIW